MNLHGAHGRDDLGIANRCADRALAFSASISRYRGAASRISASVAGGSKLKRVPMFLHMLPSPELREPAV